MKSTGIVRRVDQLGRIVVPIELRRNLGLGSLEPVEIYVDGDKIVLEKYQPSCLFCGETEGVILFHDKPTCVQCREAIQKVGKAEA
ncbi:AbrB/MazE/SpoVT family DNA-binding domain-containing protein [Alicyclobacillaceae bacterium I2511]|nr:AbrB/MazE/SpoVT family DNA-binding domain-containing protein [Alicyclobacillaceae bacterium I2511]